MNSAKRKHYRAILQELRERVGGEVNYVVRSIHEGVNINENVSAAPVHLADVAGDTVDADVQVLQTERSILDEINAALARIDEGTFGACTDFGNAAEGASLHGNVRAVCAGPQQQRIVRYTTDVLGVATCVSRDLKQSSTPKKKA
jgi:RNA polymerase-binding transcription factor DksA